MARSMSCVVRVVFRRSRGAEVLMDILGRDYYGSARVGIDSPFPAANIPAKRVTELFQSGPLLLGFT
jgi:hypothetical protein